MGAQLTKDSIDLGIVVRNADASLAFYRDVLGFEHIASGPMPGGSIMHSLMCGSSMIKLVAFDPVPEAAKVLNISTRSAERLWTFARAWLRRAIEGS